MVTHFVSREFRALDAAQIIHQPLQLEQREVRRLAIDQQHELRVLVETLHTALGKGRRPGDLASLDVERQLVALAKNPAPSVGCTPSLRGDDARLLASCPADIDERGNHDAVAALSEAAEAVEKPHAAALAIVEGHAGDRADAVRGLRLRLPAELQPLQQRPRFLHRPRNHARVEPARQNAAQDAHAPDRSRDPAQAHARRAQRRKLMVTMKLTERVQERDEQRQGQQQRQVARHRHEHVHRHIHQPCARRQQIAQIAIHHLHQHQSEHRDEHQGENLEPFAQKITVKSVQRRPSQRPRPPNATPHRATGPTPPPCKSVDFPSPLPLTLESPGVASRAFPRHGDGTQRYVTATQNRFSHAGQSRSA